MVQSSLDWSESMPSPGAPKAIAKPPAPSPAAPVAEVRFSSVHVLRQVSVVSVVKSCWEFDINMVHLMAVDCIVCPISFKQGLIGGVRTIFPDVHKIFPRVLHFHFLFGTHAVALRAPTCAACNSLQQVAKNPWKWNTDCVVCLIAFHS